MTNRLITPQFMEAMKDFPLYSQERKGDEAICVAVFYIGRIRWYVLEGQQEGDDFVFFAVGLRNVRNGIRLCLGKRVGEHRD